MTSTVSSPPGLSKPSPKKIHWLEIKETLTGYAFILPAYIIIGVFGLFPIAFAAYVSLFQWRITPGDFTGLGNYVKAVDNLAYIFAFWIAILLLYWLIKETIFLYKTAREHLEKPWLFFLPAIIVTGGIGQFIRFAVLLLPEILDIANKVRGLERTQELFVGLLKEAWLTPVVQDTLRISLLLFVCGFLLFFGINRWLYHSTRNLSYFTSCLKMVIFISSAMILLWFTWTQISLAYSEAAQNGEALDISAQIITISAGFVLLALSYFLWRSAGQRQSMMTTIFRMLAAIVLAIGSWVLIGEIPSVVSAGDDKWWESLLVTVYYSIGTVPVQLGISLVLATLLFQNIKGKGFFRLIYFLPYITPAVAAAAVFKVFFSGKPTAPMNSFLQILGFNPLEWLNEPKGITQLLAGASIELPVWLAGPSLALIVIILYNIWSYVGYDTVIFLAGLGNIPREMYEAASMDGADKFAQFRHITLPLLSPTTYFLTLLAVIGTFKAFNHIWVLRSGAALGTTDTATIVIFTEFTRNTRYGYAAALSIVLLGVILVLTIINNRIAEKRVFYG